jgi:dihydrofolate reductase
MRKIVVINHLTLDGVMQAPSHPDEDRRGGFDRGGWAGPYADPALADARAEDVAAADALLLGRRTYESLAALGSQRLGDEALEGAIGSMPVHVASRTLAGPLGWGNATLLAGDAGEAVTALKREEGGNVLVLGSGELISSLREAFLIDEYLLSIHPLVLGTGRRLFPDGVMPALLHLHSMRGTSTGVILARYGSGVY